MIYEIFVKSSDGITYHQVTVKDYKGKLKIDCSCIAADFGNICKHRAAIITGKYGKLIDKDDVDYQEAINATNLIAERGIQAKYLELDNKLNELKKRFKNEEKSIKNRIKELIS
ncbi:SWIM zinc finger family protein [Escherichia coli]|uniref:SWIM zinc finger family protein n=1 Tax=Escherichia coli TaxID=562 RepID=UPI003855B0EE